jgi:hypothetical protein
MIIKVQRSQFSSDGQDMLLVYDRSRRLKGQFPTPPEIAELMGDRPKIFVHAEVVGSELDISGEAPWQEW